MAPPDRARLLTITTLALALAGCGGGASASPAPSTTATEAAPTPSATATPPAAESAAPSIRALTGHVSVPEYGFSMDLPDGWQAVDLTAGDVDSLSRSVEELFADAAVSGEQVAQIIASGGALFAYDLDPRRVADGFAANLNILVVPAGNAALDAVVDASVSAIEASLHPLDGIQTEIVQLPAGESAHLSYDIQPAGSATIHQDQYYVIHGDQAFVLTLSRSASQDERRDEFEAIAQSWEFAS